MILDHVNKMLIIGDLDKIDDTEPCAGYMIQYRSCHFITKLEL